jgi:7,8-dihydroneopterin aldolase/epimerase/oxygenase
MATTSSSSGLRTRADPLVDLDDDQHMNTREDHDDWLQLDGFAFPCTLGLLDWEQHTTQTLAVELGLGLDLDPAAGGDLARSVDYAAIVEQVQFLAQHGRWRMLESMAVAIARLLLAPPAPGEERAQVRRAVVRLSKPEVFRGRAVPSVEIRRDLDWCQLAQLPREDAEVRVEVLQETIESGAYRVHLHEDARWSRPAEMSCLVISGRVRANGAELGRGAMLSGGGEELCALTTEGACLLAVGECRLSALRAAEKRLR